MNQSQIRTRIIIIRVIDWILLLSIMGAGITGIFYSNSPKLAGFLLFLGIGIVHLFGRWSTTKIAQLRVIERKLRREQN